MANDSKWQKLKGGAETRKPGKAFSKGYDSIKWDSDKEKLTTNKKK